MDKRKTVDNFQQQGVLITGASSGFGKSLACAFAQAHYRIVAHGMDESRLRDVQQEIEAETSSKIFTVVADLRNSDGVRIVAESMREHHVNILINNAAVNPELHSGKLITDIKEIQNIITINTSALIALSMSAYEQFASADGGLIVMVNSVAGLKGSAHESVYAASKFGVRGFSESVKEAWRQQGVRLMDVYSGGIATGMSVGRSDKDSLIDPDELARYIVQAAAPESFFVRELHVQKTLNGSGRA